MTDQPQGTMLKIKLKRNDDGTRTLDPHDPMTPLLMAALKGNVLTQLDNLLNPEGDDMPEITSATGIPGYEFPDAGPTQTMEANQTKEHGQEPSRSAGTIKGGYLGADHDDRYMRRQALEMAASTHAGQPSHLILEVAEEYYNFLAGNTEELAKAVPSD